MRIENFARNARIFEDVIRGNTWSAAAAAEGLTTERSRQVVHKMCRMMINPKRLGTDIVPNVDYLDIKEMRNNAEFWLAQLAKFRNEQDE